MLGDVERALAHTMIPEHAHALEMFAQRRIPISQIPSPYGAIGLYNNFTHTHAAAAEARAQT